LRKKGLNESEGKGPNHPTFTEILLNEGVINKILRKKSEKGLKEKS